MRCRGGNQRGEQPDEVARELSKVLADSFAVYQKTHGYHWNVRGPNFSQLHALFMAQYTEMWTAIDEVAERIRAEVAWLDRLDAREAREAVTR